jgi:hypothetical protein
MHTPGWAYRASGVADVELVPSVHHRLRATVSLLLLA